MSQNILLNTYNRRVSFSLIAASDNHAEMITEGLVNAGGVLDSYYALDKKLITWIQARWPSAIQLHSIEDILSKDESELIVGCLLPKDQSSLGLRVMQSGKDYLSDRPGFLSLSELEKAYRVSTTTGRFFLIIFCEHHLNRSVQTAKRLIKQGVIGKIIQVINTGPHKAQFKKRPKWFFKKNQYGGIFAFIGCHQFSQLVDIVGEDDFDILFARVGNFTQPTSPEFEEFGEVLLVSREVSAHIRVDWLSPNKLTTFGDGRLFIQGTEGHIEVRKFIDVAGRSDGDHLFLVNHNGAKYINCKEEPLNFCNRVLEAIKSRKKVKPLTDDCYKVVELYLKTQEMSKTLAQHVIK